MYFNTQSVKESLTIEDVAAILEELGAEPQIAEDKIYCRTVCHDGDSTDKLVYFHNTGYFYCRTHCGTIGDIFDLLSELVPHDNFNELVNYVATRMENTPAKYQKSKAKTIDSAHSENEPINLAEMDSLPVMPHYVNPLRYFPKPVIKDWQAEGISKEICDKNDICYDPINGAILIPHYDKYEQLVGIKARTLIKEQEASGKYRMYTDTQGKCYKFPVLMDVYGLDFAKHSIKRTGKAYVFEAEKSVLEARSFCGTNDVPFVSVNGSNLSKFQMKELYDCGARDFYICFDKDYADKSEPKYQELIEKYKKIAAKYSDSVRLHFVIDNFNLLQPHDSPTDEGQSTFEFLVSVSIEPHELATL